MLVRRFTMVCLICMIFGMVLSDVVVSTSQQAHSKEGPGQAHCIGDKTVRCSIHVGE